MTALRIASAATGGLLGLTTLGALLAAALLLLGLALGLCAGQACARGPDS